MKAVDMKGREIKAGDTIAYALTAGRSANLAIYQVDQVVETDAHGWHRNHASGEQEYGKFKVTKIKATKLSESYGWSDGKARQATLAMADERALVINETAKVWA
jgi:hypothetical protein